MYNIIIYNMFRTVLFAEASRTKWPGTNAPCPISHTRTTQC